MSGNGQPPQGTVAATRTCRGIRVDGEPCRAPGVGESGYCFWHDPERREELLEATRRGGQRRGIQLPTVRPLEAEEARSVLAGVLEALLVGAVDPGTARAAAYILQVERKIAESAELEQRLAAVEAALEARTR